MNAVAAGIRCLDCGWKTVSVTPREDGRFTWICQRCGHAVVAGQPPKAALIDAPQTPPPAKKAVRPPPPAPVPLVVSRPLPLDTLMRLTCRALAVTLDDVRSTKRYPAVVLARMVIVRCARLTTIASFPEIAVAMGRPNHSTVATAHGRFLEQRSTRVSVFIGHNMIEPRVADMTIDELVGDIIRAAATQTVDEPTTAR